MNISILEFCVALVFTFLLGSGIQTFILTRFFEKKIVREEEEAKLNRSENMTALGVVKTTSVKMAFWAGINVFILIGFLTLFILNSGWVSLIDPAWIGYAILGVYGFWIIFFDRSLFRGRINLIKMFMAWKRGHDKRKAKRIEKRELAKREEDRKGKEALELKYANFIAQADEQFNAKKKHLQEYRDKMKIEGIDHISNYSLQYVSHKELAVVTE